MRIHSVVLLLLALAACRSPDDPTTTILRIRGTVAAAATQAPISGAQVTVSWSAGAFGTGGSNPAGTDNAGAYSLSVDFGGSPFTCVGMAMNVDAAGYKAGYIPPGRLRCVEDFQVIDFSLTP